MLRARNTYVALALSCLSAALILPSEVRAAAGGVLECTAGSTCVVGEFLYDDASAPINGATCTIVSWYPNDTSFLNTSMSGPTQSDGWYSKSFTAPSTTGLYRTTVSCSVSGDTLTIDKSFQVNTASSSDPNTIAAAVWNYSTRTVSSFGDLIGNIWNNATRTITGAGLSSGNLATQDDVIGIRNQINNLSTSTGDLSSIKTTVNETRLLIEKVVNKPIIENVLEDTTPDLSEKLKGTRAQANQLYVNNQYLTTQAATLASKWNSLSGKDALNMVISMSQVLGESADSSSANSMFGSANWVKDSWNWNEGNTIYSQLSTINDQVADLKDGLADYQKSPALLIQVKALVKSSLALEKSIGSASDKTSSKTLFAKINSTETLAISFDQKNTQIDSALTAYKKTKEVKGISDLQNQVVALNKIPGGLSAITKPNYKDPVSVVNNLLSLKGIIGSNLKMLSLGAGKTMVNVWLEVGSIVFKTMATNPSSLVSQDVEIKYYLPQEIKREDIIKTDAGLTVEYDSEKDQLYVAGTFNLTPGQTRTFSVETKDIWYYSQAEIDSLRKQAEELYKPLEKTAYYAQGVTLKSDISANLDEMSQIQSSASTPEEKIKAYRECAILKDSVNTKLTAMKELVTQASAAGNLFGFVGGAQTIAVWGLILVIATGFVLMTIYMRTIMGKAKNKKALESKKSDNKGEDKIFKPTSGARHGINPLTFASVLIASTVLSATISGVLVRKIVAGEYEQKLSVLGTAASAPAPQPTPEVDVPSEDLTSQEVEESIGVGGPYVVTVLDTPTGFLRVRKSPSGVEIAQVSVGDKLIFLDEQAGWYNVQLEDGTEGWVSTKYAIKE